MDRRRTVTTAALLIALSTSAPAGATHFDGNGATGSFDPAYAVSVVNALGDQTSSFTIRLTARDHEDPPITGDFRIPGAWQFDQTAPEIRRGQKPDGSPATNCDHAIDGLGNGTNSDARFARAERIGSSVLVAHVDGISRTSAPGSPANPTDTPIRFDGHHAFLSWNADTSTAKLCLLLITEDARVTSIPEVEGVTEIVAGYDLKRVDGEWQVFADLRDLIQDETLQMLNASLIEFSNTYFAVSAGNWAPSPVAVSRNPAAEGTYTFRAIFETCPQNDPAYGACRSNRTTVTRAVPIAIRLPVTGLHPIPKLLSPAPYSILAGTFTVPVRWEEIKVSERPVGYVLAVARPGEPHPERIHRARLVEGDAGYPCDGSGVCSLTLSFPLVTTPFQEPLPADGRYSVGVVAIFSDGHRSDGRCDDGTALGSTTSCSAALTHRPGWTGAEFLLRERAWPLRYRDALTSDVLLVDPGARELEYVVWHRNSAMEESYLGRDALMTTDGSSGRFQLVSPVLRWSVGGLFTPVAAVAVAMRPTNTVFLPGIPAPLPLPRQFPVPGGHTIGWPRTFVGTPA